MKRVYLTETIPDNAIVSSGSGKRKTSAFPDIQQKLEAYNESKQDYANVPPSIRPYPLEKYQTNKHDTIITPSDRDEEIQAGESSADPTQRKTRELIQAIDSLPKHVRSRARRLVPHLARVNTGDLDLKKMIYDLVVPNVKRIKTERREVLASVIRQLQSDATLNQNIFINKLAAASSDPPKQRAHPSAQGHPTRSRVTSWTPLVGRYYAGKQQQNEWL